MKKIIYIYIYIYIYILYRQSDKQRERERKIETLAEIKRKWFFKLINYLAWK